VDKGIILRTMDEGKMSCGLSIYPLLSRHFAGTDLGGSGVVRLCAGRGLGGCSRELLEKILGGVNAPNDEISRPSKRLINKQPPTSA
jgi:hypothetical protein